MDQKTQDIFLVKCKSNDMGERNKFLSIVGKDDTKHFKNGAWQVQKSTIDLLLEVFPESDLILVNPNFEIGKKLKLNLYDYQKDIVKFCLEKKNAIIAAACGAGRLI